MKKLLIVGLAIFVTGCAAIKNPITNNTLGGIIDSMGIADSALIAYRGLPRCTTAVNFSITNICHKRSVLVAAQAYDAAANAAINKAVAFTIANPTVDATSVVAAAQDALTIFASFETANGIK